MKNRHLLGFGLLLAGSFSLLSCFPCGSGCSDEPAATSSQTGDEAAPGQSAAAQESTAAAGACCDESKELE